MNTTEDRAREAMRAAARTVNDAPPLRLPRRHSAERAPRHGLRMWIVPLTAAAAVIAAAAALVAVRDSGGGRAAPQVTPPPATAVPPRYYVALNQPASGTPASLVVGDTLTGAKIATVPPPAGGTFAGVTAAADDRTFAVDSEPGSPGDESASLQPRTWYLLRIAPGSAHPAQLSRLPIPVTTFGTDVEAIALSPDGSKLATAVQPGYPTDLAAAPAYLRVYSVATGATLRSWSTRNGNAAFGGPDAGHDRNTVLFWRDDGRTLSFTSSWTTGEPPPVNGSSVRPTGAQARNVRVYATVRVLEIGGSGRDLIADSRLALSTVTYPDRRSASARCLLGNFDLLVSPDGKVIVCAATDVFRDPGTHYSIGCLAVKPWRDLEFLEYSAVTGRRLTVLDKYPTNCNAALSAVYALWVSKSGDAVIGYAGPGPSSPPGQRQPVRRFGIFRQGRFTPLPAPLTGGDYLLVNQIAW